MQAMRARKLAETDRGPRRPLPPQIGKATRELRRVVEQIERLSEDDRFKKSVAHDRELLLSLADRLDRAVTKIR